MIVPVASEASLAGPTAARTTAVARAPAPPRRLRPAPGWFPRRANAPGAGVGIDGASILAASWTSALRTHAIEPRDVAHRASTTPQEPPPQRPLRAAAMVRAMQSRRNVVTNPPPAATA